MDDYCDGKYQIQRKTELTLLPESYTTLMDAYLQKCRDDGNRESTIIEKRYFLREFYCHLESLGCHDLRDADDDRVHVNHVREFTHMNILQFIHRVERFKQL